MNLPVMIVVIGSIVLVSQAALGLYMGSVKGCVKAAERTIRDKPRPASRGRDWTPASWPGLMRAYEVALSRVIAHQTETTLVFHGSDEAIAMHRDIQGDLVDTLLVKDIELQVVSSRHDKGASLVHVTVRHDSSSIAITAPVVVHAFAWKQTP
jgi:hypothetical protein